MYIKEIMIQQRRIEDIEKGAWWVASKGITRVVSTSVLNHVYPAVEHNDRKKRLG